MDLDVAKNTLYSFITILVGGDESFKDRDCALVDQVSEMFLGMRKSKSGDLRLFAYQFLKTLPCDLVGLERARKAVLQMAATMDPVRNFIIKHPCPSQ